MALPELLQFAAEHRRAGRLGQAKEIYQKILEQEPKQPIALFFLGVIAQQQRETEAAIDFLRRAVAAKPDFAEAQCNLGALLASLNRCDEAIVPLQIAVQYQPANIDALFNLAMAFNHRERYTEAIAVFHRLIAIRENLPDAHYELGNALVNTSRLEEAIKAYQRAITLDPTFADAYCNLGATLCERGDYAQAITMAKKAISLSPQNAAAYSNLGEALRQTAQYDAAKAACVQAIKVDPDFFDAYVNLAAIFCDQKQLGDAIKVCQTALGRNSKSAAVHAILAELLREEKRLDEAEKQAHQAIACDAKYAPAHRNLGNIYKDQGKMALAIESLQRAVALRPTHANIHSTLVFAANYCCDFDSSQILSEARAWAERHERPLQGAVTPHDPIRVENRRLRIGYVSADFNNHPVARSLLPLLENHDHEQFEIICYSNSTKSTPLTEKLRACANSWRNIVGISDEQLAAEIKKDKIDILVDLGLHTGGNRLLTFAPRPAPVQITWLGYPGTTGMQNMDYRLSDPYLDPPGQLDAAYSEQTIRLPNSFWCFNARMMEEAPPVNALPALRNGYVTFGCLNNFCKVNEPLLDLWKLVLDGVPGSRLVLLTCEGSHRDVPRQKLGERVEFLPMTSRQEYLQYYQRLDISLDTLPYGGHTTSFDSIWMGVPILSLVGKTVVGRAGLSLLSNLGLSDLVATSEKDFVRRAIDLAGNLPQITALRKTLRDKAIASPLMDGRQFAKDVESAFRRAWRS